jgi:hypothetical protein
MKKREPSKAELAELMLEAICTMYVEDMDAELNMSQDPDNPPIKERIAQLKQWVREGRFVIETTPDGKKVRLKPAVGVVWPQ